MSRVLRPATLLGIFLSFCGLAAPALAKDTDEHPDLPFHLPTPEGWRTETIPFPLGFAPELEYEGVEEVRFAPGMFEAGADDVWTYLFVWWIPESTELSAKTLEQDLVHYYRGLSLAVAKSNGFEPEAPTFKARLEPVDGSRTQLKLAGQVETFDAFVSRQQTTLNLQVDRVACKDQGKQAFFFHLSPQPTNHPVWKQLAEIQSGFRCRR